MGPVGGMTSRRVGLLFIVLTFFQFALAQGPVPVTFRYGGDGQSFQLPDPNNHESIKEIHDNNITCMDDFKSSGGSLVLASGTTAGNILGRCVYQTPVQLIESCVTSPTDFSTMFEVLVSPANYTSVSLSLEGLAFIIGNAEYTATIDGTGGGYLGWLKTSSLNQAPPPPTGAYGSFGPDNNNNNFAVEIDFHQDVQFQDPVGIHAGVDKNNLTSVQTTTIEGLGDWLSPAPANFTLVVWIKYDGSTHIVDVFVAWAPGFDQNLSDIAKPTTPNISTNVDLLTDVLQSEGMLVGFSGAISGKSSSFSIRTWTFNSDGPSPDVVRANTGTTASFQAVKDAERRAEERRRRREIITIVAITVPSVLVSLALFFIIGVLYRRNARLTALARKYQIEEGVLDRGAQNFKYRALSTATEEFSTLLGTGGFGSVYKGSLVLKGDGKPTEIAVKRISATSQQGAQEFVAEVKIIGQVQHRNLVRLLGWCHEKGELLLVYDYMPHGSVDQHLYNNSLEEPVLTWSRRLKIVSGVATALAYLHEEWEQRVIHRDVKSANVMLDRDFNARLGDFGLARLSAHGQAPSSTLVAGTHGYLAPELLQTLKPTEKTDVYSFGALVLEVATGKKPLLSREDREAYDKNLLVDWVWGLYGEDALLEAADCTLRNTYDPGEMIMFLKIGLLCSHPNPDERPTMREVVNIWTGSRPFPPLARSKPVPVFLSRMADLLVDKDEEGDTKWMMSTDYSSHENVPTVKESFAMESDGPGSVTIDPKDVGGTLVPQKHEGRIGSPDPNLRYRHKTRFLPFY